MTLSAQICASIVVTLFGIAIFALNYVERKREKLGKDKQAYQISYGGKIPEAGIERDVVIARLKGCQTKIVGSGATLLLRKRHTPAWSTDRNAAWELWDEIESSPDIIGIDYQSNKPGFGTCAVSFSYAKEKFSTNVFFGKSFSDVVSQAWIAWKLKPQSEVFELTVGRV